MYSTGCRLGLPRLHAERANALARLLVAQRREKCLHRRTLAAILDDQEIVVFRRYGEEAEPVELGTRFDGEPPVRAALRDRGGNGVVRFRLVGVTGRPRAFEQLVDQ